MSWISAMQNLCSSTIDPWVMHCLLCFYLTKCMSQCSYYCPIFTGNCPIASSCKRFSFPFIHLHMYLPHRNESNTPKPHPPFICLPSQLEMSHYMLKKTIKRHYDYINMLAFLHNRSLFASGSDIIIFQGNGSGQKIC